MYEFTRETHGYHVGDRVKVKKFRGDIAVLTNGDEVPKDALKKV